MTINNRVVMTGKPNPVNARHKAAIEWARLGWEDARNGRGFSHQYESASPTAQNNYEIGRIQAVNVIAAGLKAPKWPDNVVLPKWVDPLWNEAARIAGNARPDIRE